MKTETLQKLGASALLLVVALLSALWLAGTVSSPELHAQAMAALDEKKDEAEPVRPFKSYLDKDGDAR